MKDSPSISVNIGGAFAKVLAIRGDLLLEVVQVLQPQGEHGILLVWKTELLHDLAALPPTSIGDVAFISEGGRILEIHDTEERPFQAGHPFRYAALMEHRWFDTNCTSSWCDLNLD